MNIKNNKKGFTLIELLAVIIILAVIALIATLVVLNVVDNARKEANKNSAYGLLDAAKLYYAESLLDISKQSNINGITNLIYEIKVSGKIPDSGGEIYINNVGQSAIAVVYGKVCYKKNFEENTITESEDTDNCTINTVETPQVSYKCRRATTLHTEECTQTSTSNYCSGQGYTASGSKGTTTITYGNLGTAGTLASGDAFDCDVNGDGVYDATTERFYYVSDLYNTTTKEFDSNYAVLVYYNNTTAGVADNTSASKIAYYADYDQNWHGPVTAITNLPTTTQWNNVSLSSTSRAILTETGTTSTSGGPLPTSYSYSGYAARLLIAQEINSACGITVGSLTIGELDTCNYLMENTKYSSSSLGTYGYWLETPWASYSHFVWSVNGNYRRVNYTSAYNAGGFGVRPAIEVLKSDISY